MEKPDTKTQASIKESLESFFDQLIDFLEVTNEAYLNEKADVWYGPCSRLAVLTTMDNHLSHHRGQLVVYLRLLDIKPPSYIGW